MKEGTRWLIRPLMLLPIIITLLNNPLLKIDNPREGYVVHAAAAVGGAAGGEDRPSASKKAGNPDSPAKGKLLADGASCDET